MSRSYITIKTTQINTVDFREVVEDKATLRYSLDGTEFVYSDNLKLYNKTTAKVPKIKFNKK